MNEFATLEAAFAQIRERDGRYHERAYVFVLAALEFAQGRLPARRHLTGGELSWACRDFALEQFGLLAPTVLEYWGINTTADIGRIVFLLIEVGLLAKQDNDRNGSTSNIGGPHPNVLPCLFCDGHVQNIPMQWQYWQYAWQWNNNQPFPLP